jgi:hypothetical protein
LAKKVDIKDAPLRGVILVRDESIGIVMIRSGPGNLLIIMSKDSAASLHAITHRKRKNDAKDN